MNHIAQTHVPVSKVAGLYARRSHIHFVGIGGVGMSGIAEVLLNQGHRVSGSDLKNNSLTEKLKQLGARIEIGHGQGNLEDADVLVVSTAIPKDNPELLAAKERQIPVLRRAEMLAELMRLKFGIAVAGSHGKTTTTSLVAAVLAEGGLDPTVVVGGKVNKLGSTSQLGHGPYMVAEADESDGSFLHLTPTLGVVTNIDREHLDHYKGGIEQIKQHFLSFVHRLPFYGRAFVCSDNLNVRDVLSQMERRYVTYGFEEPAMLRASNVECNNLRFSFDVDFLDKPLGRFELPMVGRHNVQNALAAIAISLELGLEKEVIAKGLSEFGGVDRRFSVRGEVDGVVVVDDYGHHPHEIRMTVEGARAAYNDRRIFVAFQPHRYSRTRDFIDEFAQVLALCDVVTLLPIYSAGEKPIDGINSKLLADKVKRLSSRPIVSTVNSLDEAQESIVNASKSGDLVLCFGAGDISSLGAKITASLSARAGT